MDRKSKIIILSWLNNSGLIMNPLLWRIITGYQWSFDIQEKMCVLHNIGYYIKINLFPEPLAMLVLIT